jgi:hypothetical protein
MRDEAFEMSFTSLWGRDQCSGMPKAHLVLPTACDDFPPFGLLLCTDPAWVNMR